MYQPAPNKPYQEPTVTVNGQKLAAVDKFTYLGSTLSRCVHIDDEINARIAKASSTFGRLRSTVWERKGVSLSTKLSVYRAIVLTTLLYASETWTVYQRHAKKLNRFHLNCLRKLLRVKWQDKVPDTEILEQTDMPSIFTMLRKSQLRWAGHVVRMSDKRLPKRVLYGELQAGARLVGDTCSKPASLAWSNHQRSGSVRDAAHWNRPSQASCTQGPHPQCSWSPRPGRALLPSLFQDLPSKDWPNQPPSNPPQPPDKMSEDGHLPQGRTNTILIVFNKIGNLLTVRLTSTLLEIKATVLSICHYTFPLCKFKWIATT